MSEINTGGPAFPVSSYVNVDGETHESQPQGMQMRDYFAAKALQGICASGPGATWTDERLAKDSYRLADAMIKARQS